MNGSGVQIASTWPLLSADRIAGNGSASSLTEFGSTPTFLSAALIITSPTPLSALTAIVLPGEVGGRPDRARALDEDVLPVVGLARALDLARRDRA